MLTFIDPKFYEAQAVILSNMGHDKEALEIYVFKLKNFEKAEEQVCLSNCKLGANLLQILQSSSFRS